MWMQFCLVILFDSLAVRLFQLVSLFSHVLGGERVHRWTAALVQSMSKAVLIYSVDDYRRNHDRPGKQYPLLGQVYTTIPCIVEFIYNYLYILGMRGFRPVADVSSSSHSLLGSLSLSLYLVLLIEIIWWCNTPSWLYWNWYTFMRTKISIVMLVP